ncbi:hypothetical protein MTO96_003357 [Rhipicephalus appendiculatus]
MLLLLRSSSISRWFSRAAKASRLPHHRRTRLAHSPNEFYRLVLADSITVVASETRDKAAIAAPTTACKTANTATRSGNVPGSFRGAGTALGFNQSRGCEICLWDFGKRPR